jgi:hypothetical protein
MFLATCGVLASPRIRDVISSAITYVNAEILAQLDDCEPCSDDEDFWEE